MSAVNQPWAPAEEVRAIFDRVATIRQITHEAPHGCGMTDGDFRRVRRGQIRLGALRGPRAVRYLRRTADRLRGELVALEAELEAVKS